jgi:hypothetical protein
VDARGTNVVVIVLVMVEFDTLVCVCVVAGVTVVPARDVVLVMVRVSFCVDAGS